MQIKIFKKRNRFCTSTLQDLLRMSGFSKFRFALVYRMAYLPTFHSQSFENWESLQIEGLSILEALLQISQTTRTISNFVFLLMEKLFSNTSYCLKLSIKQSLVVKYPTWSKKNLKMGYPQNEKHISAFPLRDLLLWMWRGQKDINIYKEAWTSSIKTHRVKKIVNTKAKMIKRKYIVQQLSFEYLSVQKTGR